MFALKQKVGMFSLKIISHLIVQVFPTKNVVFCWSYITMNNKIN